MAWSPLLRAVGGAALAVLAAACVAQVDGGLRVDDGEGDERGRRTTRKRDAGGASPSGDEESPARGAPVAGDGGQGGTERSSSDAGVGAPAPFAVSVDRAYLEARLRELAGRERGSVAGRAQARAVLRREYAALGLAVREEAFASGTNVVAEKPGAVPGRWLLVTAHYDSMSNAGADDDGTGVVSALAVARALRDAPTRAGLRFVAFDQEEQGLLGSKAYVAAQRAAGAIGTIAGAVNLEMTGYDGDDDGKFHAMDCGRPDSVSLAAHVVQAIAARPDLRLVRADACTDRSDHASFWAAGVPAIVVGEAFFAGDGNPCYHQACDTVERVGFDYMRRLTEAVAIAVLRAAE